jgi:hypothetical protein
MVPNRKITNDCIALGFYSVAADSNDVQLFYNEVIAWFNAVQCPPDKLSVHGKGFGGKPVGFAKTNARLFKQGFSDVKAFTVTKMLPDGAIPVLDWWAGATLDLGVGLRPYFALEARASVSTLEDDALTRLIASCLSNLKPVYGIGFHRNHDQGPGFYAVGVNYGSPVQETPIGYDEALTISRWGDLGVVKEVYKQGTLRDVYPHNYLSEPQLTRRVGGQTLQDWILSDSSRGTLVRLDDRMKLWKVAAPQIKSIREALWAAGIIFDWKTYLDE